MEILQIRPSGYCKGVTKAIIKVKQAIKDYPDKQIYILGMLIHNKYVVDAFTTKKIITLDNPEKSKKELLDEIEDGVIIFTAHGINPKIKQYAINKGLTVIDAACSDVTKNTELCNSYLNKGYDIIYIGKKNHPESEAVICLSDKIHLISNENDLLKLSIENDKILVTNQTTMSILDINNLIILLKKQHPEAIIAEELCNATRARQNAIRNIKDSDCLIVVGDPNSNNTTQLANIARSNNIKKVLKIENARELKNEDFTDVKKVAITAGASTPSYLTNQVINYLKTFDEKYFEIDLEKVLDI